VLRTFLDDRGSYLVALIAYYGFLSVCPPRQFFSVLGFVPRGDPSLQQRIVGSARNQIGEELGGPGHLGGRGGGLMGDIVGTLSGGPNAMNVAWAVTRTVRPSLINARGRSILRLLHAGLRVLGTPTASAVGTTGRAFGADLGLGCRCSCWCWCWCWVPADFRLATAGDLDWRTVQPGAVFAAVGWQAAVAGLDVRAPRCVRRDREQSHFAPVLGLIAFFWLRAVVA
jgi:membrane protein